MVCSSQWDVLTALCCVLEDSNTTQRDYRQALLVLSNLTVPVENKAVVLLQPDHAQRVLQVLCNGIAASTTNTSSNNNNNTKTSQDQQQQQQQPQQRMATDVDLCCAVLFNLSYLHDGRPVLVNFVPQQTETLGPNGATATTTTTLLSTLQDLMERCLPYVAPSPPPQQDQQQVEIQSVQRQAMRWTMGFFQNLCGNSNPSVAAPAMQQAPQLPLIALQVLQRTPVPATTTITTSSSSSSSGGDAVTISQWKPQSLEDFCLGFLVELALREQQQQQEQETQRDPIVPLLHTTSVTCAEYLQDLLVRDNDEGGIHSIRAKAIVRHFDGTSQ